MTRGGRGRAAAALLGLALLAGGCADEGPRVVLYASADDHVAREVVADFEAETGIRVELVGDTEALKTTGLVERLRAERGRPIADVFWSSECALTIALAEEGVLAPHDSPTVRAWPAEHRGPEGRWFAFAARARVIAFHADRVADPPGSWTDLVRDRWRGRIVMADPRFGTTGVHLGAMKALWDRRAMPGYYEAWLEGIAANGVRMLPGGNAAVIQAILDGEADLGLTDTDDVWAARARGLPIGLVFPDHGRSDPATAGTLLIPNTVALVAGGPHPEAAARLVDHLLSERVERLLAESLSHNVPLGPGRAALAGEWAPPVALAIDLHAAAAQREAAIRAAMALLGEAGSAADDAR